VYAAAQICVGAVCVCVAARSISLWVRATKATQLCLGAAAREPGSQAVKSDYQAGGVPSNPRDSKANPPRP
jgi:hypothetical protein